MIFQYMCLCFSLLRIFVASAFENPTGVRIQEDVTELTANVTWRVPRNTRVIETIVDLRKSNGRGELRENNVLMPSTSFLITDQLQLCEEYDVGLSFSFGNGTFSNRSVYKFVMTAKTYTANNDMSITIPWTTSLENFYQVLLPSGKVLFETSPKGSMSQGFHGDSKYVINHTNSRDTEIQIKQVNKSDAGLYKTVSPLSGKIDNCALLVVTDNPETPHLSVLPQQSFVGDDITFTCNSSVQRWPEYFTSSLSYTYHGINGTRNGDDLVVQDVSPRHTGLTVTCTATDDLNLKSGSSNMITMNPFYGPDDVYIESYQQKINIIERDSIGPLNCTADCYPHCNIEWNVNYRGTFHSFSNLSVISFMDIRRNQSGIYRCKVTHTSDRTKTRWKDITINVQHPSMVNKVKLNQINYSEGKRCSFSETKTLNITVIVDGNPVSDIYFYKTGANRLAVNYFKTGTTYKFYRNELRCEDSGQYIIEAFNGIKYSSIKTLQLDVQCYPRNILIARNVIWTTHNSIENITVTMVANPTPNITWNRQTRHDWEETEVGLNNYRGFTQITIFDENSFGVYSMTICNKLGCAVKDVNIMADGKPDPPRSFSIVEISHNKARISFVPGFNSGRKQAFTLHFKPVDTAITGIINQTIVTNDTLSNITIYHTVVGLRANTRYHVTLTAENHHGSSSKFLEFTTNTQSDSKSPVIGSLSTIVAVSLIVNAVFMYKFLKGRRIDKNSEVKYVPDKRHSGNSAFHNVDDHMQAQEETDNGYIYEAVENKGKPTVYEKVQDESAEDSYMHMQ